MSSNWIVGKPCLHTCPLGRAILFVFFNFWENEIPLVSKYCILWCWFQKYLSFWIWTPFSYMNFGFHFTKGSAQKYKGKFGDFSIFDFFEKFYYQSCFRVHISNLLIKTDLCNMKSHIHVAKWCSNSKRKIFLKSA